MGLSKTRAGFLDIQAQDHKDPGPVFNLELDVFKLDLNVFRLDLNDLGN